MTSMRKSALIILAMLAFLGSATSARAQCLLSSIASVSTTVANLGTYTAPTPPSVQAISIVVGVNYLGTGLLGVTCSVSLYFSRPSLPAEMTIIGGGTATLPYTLQSASSGGNSIINTGSGFPPASNAITQSFSLPALALAGTRYVTFTVYGQMVPGSPQQGGSYSDTIDLKLVGGLLLVIPVTLGTYSFSVLGEVTKLCTIGSVATPAADSAIIPVNSGYVDPSPILKSYADVFCNSPSSVQLTSLNGALTGPPSLGPSFKNTIDYSAQAQFSGANATINTATIPSASGGETGTASTTTGSMPLGTMSVSITPQTNALPLAKGSYADVLRISITPN